ncbi:MAG: hypothetical protein IT317_19510 [Anaerolineales bacterium]|nr:hypothetical protein [Anaerolineales bacterium]
MTSRTLQAWGAGCGYQLLLRLGIGLLLVVVTFGCVLIVTVLPLPAGVEREAVAAIALVLGVLFVVALALAGAAGLIIWRARQLDAAFAPLGLAGRMFSLNGRQYHGVVGGRQVDVYYSRGPTLDIYVGTPLLTRLSAARRDRVGQALAGLLNRQPLALDDAHMSEVALYATDEAWARQALNDARVRDQLLRLTDDQAPGVGRFEIRQVLLQPEALLFRVHHVRTAGITAEAVREWLDRLAALLRLLEGAAPPTVTEPASAMERTLRSDRGGLFSRGLIIGLAVLGVFLVCLTGAAIVGALTAGAP